jgi:intracellular sulfur oxidation DsrE/DsrF family protein
LKTRWPALMFATLLCAAQAVHAGEAMPAEGKPFADAHIVLQLGDGDPKIQTKVLNIANNLIKHYGDPELVDLEIVTYDSGISLLYPDNPNADRISSLLVSQVRFVVCMNTVATLARVNGKEPEIIDAAIPVKTGVAHLVERAKQGYVVIRP